MIAVFFQYCIDTETEVEKALKASMLLYYSAYSTVALVHTTSTIVSGLV